MSVSKKPQIILWRQPSSYFISFAFKSLSPGRPPCWGSSCRNLCGWSPEQSTWLLVWSTLPKSNERIPKPSWWHLKIWSFTSVLRGLEDSADFSLRPVILLAFSQESAVVLRTQKIPCCAHNHLSKCSKPKMNSASRASDRSWMAGSLLSLDPERLERRGDYSMG